MKANELRIGNILMAGGIDRLVFVSAIFKTHFRCQDKDGISFEESIRVNYNPIPLSEEILLKCGFKKYPWFEGVYIKYNDSHLMIRWFKGNLIIFTCYVMESHKEMLHKNIKHIKNGLVNNLHQLQNFYFSNTGKELNTSGL